MLRKIATRRRALAVLLTLTVSAAGCSIKVRERALHQTSDLTPLTGLDGESPWLKVHLPDGGLYMLEDWRVDEQASTIAGTGTLFDARRDAVADGDFIVPLDEIALCESNVLHQSSVVAALTVLTVASLGVTAYCLSNPKACFGSCPTFYAPAEDGRPLLMAEGFSASVAPSLEAADLDALDRATAAGETFTLAMTNEALETHVVRRADLLAAPRPPGGGRVLAVQDGSWRRAQALLAPVACRAPEGDCTDLLSAHDGRERTSLADSLDLAAKETIELEFADVPAGELGLVVASRHSLLSTYLFYQGLAYLGEEAVPALVRASADGALAGSKSLGDLLGRIEIQVPAADGGWRTVGTVGETGPLAVNVHTLPLPPLGTDAPRLRLRMARGCWRLDRVALAVLSDPVTPVRIAPAIVRRDGAPDAEALAALTAPDRTLVTLPGDRYELVYELPHAGEWDLFLESRGYYLEWMRQEWLAEEDPAKAALMFGRPALALRYLAPRFKELEPDMESQFWGSRYAHP